MYWYYGIKCSTHNHTHCTLVWNKLVYVTKFESMFVFFFLGVLELLNELDRLPLSEESISKFTYLKLIHLPQFFSDQFGETTHSVNIIITIYAFELWVDWWCTVQIAIRNSIFKPFMNETLQHTICVCFNSIGISLWVWAVYSLLYAVNVDGSFEYFFSLQETFLKWPQ